MNLQQAAGATALDDFLWAARACESPAKRAKMTRSFENGSIEQSVFYYVFHSSVFCCAD